MCRLLVIKRTLFKEGLTAYVNTQLSEYLFISGGNDGRKVYVAPLEEIRRGYGVFCETVGNGADGKGNKHFSCRQGVLLFSQCF